VPGADGVGNVVAVAVAVGVAGVAVEVGDVVDVADAVALGTAGTCGVSNAAKGSDVGGTAVVGRMRLMAKAPSIRQVQLHLATG